MTGPLDAQCDAPAPAMGKSGATIGNAEAIANDPSGYGSAGMDSVCCLCGKIGLVVVTGA